MGVRKKKRNYFATLSDKQINEGLYLLFKLAARDYRKDVTSGKKSYKRFVASFIRLHQEVDGDYVVRNAHGFGMLVVSDILVTNRQWAIENLFTRSFNLEFVEKMIEAYNREEPLPASPLPLNAHDVLEYSSFTLNYHLSKMQIDHIVAICQRHNLFDVEELTPEHIVNLLECKPGFHIRLGFERGFCFLFNRLAWNGHIHARWQSIMEKGQFLIASNSERYLKAKTLAGTVSKSKSSNSNEMKEVRESVNAYFPALLGNGNNPKRK